MRDPYIWHDREHEARDQLREHAAGGHQQPAEGCPACWTLAHHERERADVIASLIGRPRDVYRRRAAA